MQGWLIFNFCIVHYRRSIFPSVLYIRTTLERRYLFLHSVLYTLKTSVFPPNFGAPGGTHYDVCTEMFSPPWDSNLGSLVLTVDFYMSANPKVTFFITLFGLSNIFRYISMVFKISDIIMSGIALISLTCKCFLPFFIFKKKPLFSFSGALKQAAV